MAFCIAQPAVQRTTTSDQINVLLHVVKFERSPAVWVLHCLNRKLVTVSFPTELPAITVTLV